MPNITDKVTNRLREQGYSLTQPRLQIFEALRDTEPLTMRELIMRVPRVDRASVYRTVELFIELGIVERLQIGWKYKLELTDEFNHHHHHLTCTQCHKVMVLPEHARLEKLLNQLAAQQRFYTTGHQLEIRGFCDDCQVFSSGK